MSERTCWVYIMTNKSGTLYTGVTGNPPRRVHEHRHRLVPGFAMRYKIDQLMYAEPFSEVRDAIARGKQIKAWRRSHKVALIASVNPEWNDLGEVWFGLEDAMNLGSPTQASSSDNDDEILLRRMTRPS
jgi:putative endonuclease